MWLPLVLAAQIVAIAAADVNNDGKPDAVAAYGAVQTLTPFLGDGRGGLRPGAAIQTPIWADYLAMGDLNGDRRLDLIVSQHDGNARLVVLLGDGKGGFAPAPGSPFLIHQATQPHIHGVILADVNGDRRLHVAASDASINAGKHEYRVSVLLGDGRGGFATVIGSPLATGRLPSVIALGDLNRDTKPDVVVGHEASKDITVMLGDSNGRFRADTRLAGCGAAFTHGCHHRRLQWRQACKYCCHS